MLHGPGDNLGAARLGWEPVAWAAHGRCPVEAAAHPWVTARGGQCSACPATRVPVPVPADVRPAGGDPGSIPELAPGLAAELEAHVASTVRALQEELWRVQERLSRLETLGAAQVRAGWAGGRAGTPHRPGRGSRAQLRALGWGWPGCGDPPGGW